MRAMCLFRSPEMGTVRGAVEERVRDGTISLRSERVLHADVGLSSALVDLVRAINTVRRIHFVKCVVWQDLQA